VAGDQTQLRPGARRCILTDQSKNATEWYLPGKADAMGVRINFNNPFGTPVCNDLIDGDWTAT
jgi:hypothetical protein